MTQKEFDIINAINVEGLDNSDWGVAKDGLTTEFYLGNDEPVEELPSHIYIWGDNSTTYCNAMHDLLNIKYDKKYYTDDCGGFLCLFWLDPQTL